MSDITIRHIHDIDIETIKKFNKVVDSKCKYESSGEAQKDFLELIKHRNRVIIEYFKNRLRNILTNFGIMIAVSRKDLLEYILILADNTDEINQYTLENLRDVAGLDLQELLTNYFTIKAIENDRLDSYISKKKLVLEAVSEEVLSNNIREFIKSVIELKHSTYIGYVSELAKVFFNGDIDVYISENRILVSTTDPMFDVWETREDYNKLYAYVHKVEEYIYYKLAEKAIVLPIYKGVYIDSEYEWAKRGE